MSETAAASLEDLWKLIGKIRFAMFTTRHDDGRLHSRPMTTQNRELDDEGLWFFMSRTSEPVADIARSAEVNLGYADTDGDRYVSVSGTAELVDDAATRRRLWSKMAQAWFPGGVDDPDLALVRVRIAQAEYWDVRQSKPVQMFRMAAAAVTGKPPDIGEHGRVDVH